MCAAALVDYRAQNGAYPDFDPSQSTSIEKQSPALGKPSNQISCAQLTNPSGGRPSGSPFLLARCSQSATKAAVADTTDKPTPQSIEETLAPLWSEYPQVQAAIIFGSQATGKTHNLSDIDLAVLARESGLELRMNLLSDAMRLLGTNHVDLLILNEQPPALAHRVLTEGIRIFIGDEPALVRFEEKNLSMYLDMQPFLEKVYGPG